MKKLISFVGIGSGRLGAAYEPADYCFDDGFQYKTSLIQLAIVAHERPLNGIILLMTPQSREMHYKPLQEGFVQLGIDPHCIEDCEFMDTSKQDAASQWKWFNALCEKIKDDDEIIFDFTHGFRSVPIIFATAINFLQIITKFKLLHAYYGFIDTAIPGPIKKGRIIDLVGFFILNQWATAAAFFSRSADTSLFAELAQEMGDTETFSGFKDPILADSMKKLSGIIKDIDVHHASEKSLEMLSNIKNKSSSASIPVQRIVHKIDTAFSPLAECNATSHHYDESYLRSQIKLSHILIDHGLYMQAFTTMRELIGSIGMASLGGKYAKSKFDSSDGRTKYRHMAEFFIRMCQFSRNKWHWQDEDKKNYVSLFLCFYDRLEKQGLIESLHSLTKKIVKCRNGFDHAWTVVSYPGSSCISMEAYDCVEGLENLISVIFENDLISSDKPGND